MPPRAADPAARPRAVDPVARVVGALERLTSRSNMRVASLQLIRSRMNVIRLISARIATLAPRGDGARGAPPANIQEIVNRINELIDTSNVSDQEQSGLNTSIRDLTTALTASYMQVRPPNPADLTPADHEIDRAIQQSENANRHLDPIIQAERRLVQNDQDGNYDNGTGALNHLAGGYKHSKTNSRKYMVKRFRSARNSIKRKKRRRSKRSRTRSNRK